MPSLLVGGELMELPGDKACQIISIRNPNLLTAQLPNGYAFASPWNFPPWGVSLSFLSLSQRGQGLMDDKEPLLFAPKLDNWLVVSEL